jgi:tRNA-splicing ligase RtcB
MGEIRKVVSVGFNKHKEKQNEELMPKREWDFMGEEAPIVNNQYTNALTQLGTLGGGNHFIEIQKGSDGYIWIMIHSGSRNLGLRVAEHYNKLAIELNKKYYSDVPKEWDLAFLPVESQEGQDYIREMNYCVDFAFANRKLMMDRIQNIFLSEFSEKIKKEDMSGQECYEYESSISFDPIINIAHNYTRQENHFDLNVWVHRKGATSARKGEIGIIPGSQGSYSYIVEGLGNKESFESCSHGAGRLLSRTRATEDLDLETEKKILDDKGIIHSIRSKQDLDEATGAYKSIDEVMENQKDLVKILVKLEPLAVIKG